MMRSGNPALRADVFTPLEKERSSLTRFTQARSLDSSKVMTIQGTVNRTFVLLFLTVAGAVWVWRNPEQLIPFMWPALIAGLIVGMVTAFKKVWAPYSAPLYAALEGIVLGGISVMMERTYPGIVIQAVGLTFGTLFALLIAYTSGWIHPSENFKLGVVAATGGIFLVYFVDIVLGFFGVRIPLIHESGTIGIGFSVFVVIIAALNLVLDFDFIEKGAEAGAPKYMEWYGAFGLIVTLIWLYLEILRLLAKTRRR